MDLAWEADGVRRVLVQSWPGAVPEIAGVSVTFDAVYGAATDVPEGIKRWILIRVGSLYQNREEVAALSRGSITPLPFIDGLLDPYRMALV